MYWRTSSYAVHIFDILAKTIFLCLHLPNFFIVKNDFFVTMDPLNFQSELVLCKTYQTEAKEPFNDWKYAGVRARTPCIFFFIFFIVIKNNFSVIIDPFNCSKWTCSIQNIAKPKILLMIENILAYELVRRAFFSQIFLCCQKQLFCDSGPSKCSKQTCSIPNIPKRSQRVF